MPVVGLNINNIHAKKEVERFNQVKVRTNTEIKNVKVHNLIGLEKEGLSIEFEFRTEYVSEDEKEILAKIIIGGEVLVIDEEHKEIFEKWKKDKALPENVSIQVINTLLDKCSKKALFLSDDLQMPPPIALPFARKKTELVQG